MKQVVQNLKSGETRLEEVPVQQPGAAQVLIRTQCSVVSKGTERMLVEFSKASLLSKAMQQPEKVKQVWEKIKTDGVSSAVNAVLTRLDEPLPLGYSNAGIVIATGSGVTDLHPGDRVISNGPHAEIVCVPRNLAAKIPDNVPAEEAAFTVLGSIALQGIRLINPSFGETVVVYGLGLIGQMAAQLLTSNGCRVIGFDIDPEKTALAASKNIQAFCIGDETDAVKTVMHFTENSGADAVLITASADTPEIISRAAQMSRKRGRIVLVGVVNLSLSREEFYKKELTFQVSCSYGPGRYDDHYEQKGRDYPLPFVRWTENRNFKAVLDAMAKGQLDVKPLITETVDFEKAESVYNNISSSSLATVFRYKEQAATATRVQAPEHIPVKGKGTIGIIGAGTFIKVTLLPILGKEKYNIKFICSKGGLTAKSLANKFNIPYTTTDYREVLGDPETDTVVIATRHHLHAALCAEALKAGKHVFVEKPLALSAEELDRITEAYTSAKTALSIGFNRRFAPLTEKTKSLLDGITGPLNITITVNAGALPADHWLHDPDTGGGRLIGEGCHFIDLAAFLAGSPVVSALCTSPDTPGQISGDTFSLILKMQNGSQALINYFSGGHRSFPKERIEISGQGRMLALDNFRSLTGYGFRSFSKKTLLSQDKGHRNGFTRFMNHILKGTPAPIPFAEMVNVTKTSFAAMHSLQNRSWVTIE